MIKHMDYTEYVGADPAALLCHRWNWDRRQAVLHREEREIEREEVDGDDAMAMAGG
jgi:hypothetical protein